MLFDYDASRAGAVPKRLRQGYRGTLLTDGYEPYAAVATALNLAPAGCFAHVRRKFHKAYKAQPTDNVSNSHARAALDFVRQLYQVDRPLWESEIDAAQRVRVCAELSAPVIWQFHTWLERLAPQVLTNSLLGRAIHYTLGEWSKLLTFLTHGEARLDNNRCENAIRPFLLGRKGWMFRDTVKGAVASANLYSLMETAKANDVEPYAYVSRLFSRLPHAKSVDDFDALLPWNTNTSI